MTSSSIATDPSPKTVVPWYWSAFLKRHRLPPIDSGQADLALLHRVVLGFSGLPYENATELVSIVERGPTPRLPEQVIGDHLELGGGATCYGLTYALRELLLLYGFAPRLHFGRAGDDRPNASFRPNHVALSVDLDRRRYLCDPGMVLHTPLAVGAAGEIVAHHGAREAIVLTEMHEHDLVSQLVETSTGFRQACFVDLSPIGDPAFLASWRASFDPLLPAQFLFMNQFDGAILWTVTDRFLTRRDGRARARRAVELYEVASRWGLDENVVKRAWLHTPHSRTPARMRGTIRRKLHSILDEACRRIDYFP